MVTFDEWSFSFRVDSGGDTWSSDSTQRRITSVNMDRGADVSVTNFGASSHTAGLIELPRRGWANPVQVTNRLGMAGLRTTRRGSGKAGSLDLHVAWARVRRSAALPETERGGAAN